MPEISERTEETPASTLRIPPAPEPLRQDQMEVTSPDQWNSPRKQGFLVQTPSGNVCRVHRTMDFMELVKSGKVPNPLGALIMQRLEENESAVDLQTMPPEAQVQAVIFMDEQVCRMMIEPRCMIPPEKDENGDPVVAETWQPPIGAISILDLTQEDRLFLFNVAQGGATDLATFRLIQNRVVEGVEARKHTPRPTKRTGGTERTRRSRTKK